jgi:molybdopterin adenylyltransferase
MDLSPSSPPCEQLSRPIEVVSVNVSGQKGTAKHPLDEIAVDGLGVVGDAHAGPWRRQVSLLGTASLERLAAEIGRPIGPGELGENVTVRGAQLDGVAVLDRLRLRDVELEVTQIGKQCHGRGCAIFQQVGKCAMPAEGVFARVLRGGTLHPGDRGEHLPKVLRFLIITLSDRAAAGQYADLAGPRLRELLQVFLAGQPRQAEIESVLLPDDAARLREQLVAARQGGMDAVFITGSTGVGPRDIAPETVAAFCDKIIPGIMEAIRLKYGTHNPRARLSRSIAGAAGRTQIYALPGSVRAVEEYMEEILKTVEHLIYMLHGLDVHQVLA